MSKFLSLAFLVSGLWLIPGTPADAQPPAKGWMVYKVPPLGFIDDGKVVASAGSEEEAKRVAKQFQDQEYKTGKFPHFTFIASKVEVPDPKKGDKPDAKDDAGTDTTKLLAAVIEAKQAVDRAKKVAKGEEPLLKAAERKLGDALKEYKDAVAGAYQRAVDAKKTLTEGVGGLTDAKFKQATAAVDRYNGLVRDYEAKAGSGLGSAAMDAPTAPRRMLTLAMPGGKQLIVPLSDVDPKLTAVGDKPVVELAGRVAKGDMGGSKAEFEFKEGGKFTLGGEWIGAGVWALDGTRLTMTTEKAVFLGTVDKDGTMQGKRIKRDGKELLEWSLKVTKQQAPLDSKETAFVGNWEITVRAADGNTNKWLTQHFFIKLHDDRMGEVGYYDVYDDGSDNKDTFRTDTITTWEVVGNDIRYEYETGEAGKISKGTLYIKGGVPASGSGHKYKRSK